MDTQVDGLCAVDAFCCALPILHQGHSDGGKRLGEFLEWCMDAGVEMVTAFAFSTENWKRDAHEVSLYMYVFHGISTQLLRNDRSASCFEEKISCGGSVRMSGDVSDVLRTK